VGIQHRQSANGAVPTAAQSVPPQLMSLSRKRPAQPSCWRLCWKAYDAHWPLARRGALSFWCCVAGFSWHRYLLRACLHRPYCRRDTENAGKLPPLHDLPGFRRWHRIGSDQRSGRGFVTYFDRSLANALRTSDWETPNCRAIRDGVMPALNEARIAFT
jgi:hypothetical protein